MTRRAMPVIMMFALVPALSGCGFMNYVEDASGESITRVVLEAAPADDGDVTHEAMDDAVDVLRERLETSGREVDAIGTEGSTVTTDVIGTVGEEDHPLLSEPGELAFRPVLALDGAGSSAAPSDVPDVAADVVAEFEAFDCAGAGRGAGDPALPLVTCDDAGTSKYLLGPVEVDGASVVEASSSHPPESGDWVVILEFDEAGTKAFGEVTERLQAQTEPRNQFAITVDGVVLSAPMVPPGAIVSAGVVEISGSFTRESAEALADQLRTGPLPFPFEVQDISTE